MKITLKTTLGKTFSWTALGLAAVLLVSSCKKDNGYDFDGSVSANVQLVNASPDAGAAKLYVANISRTTNAVNYGSASGYSQTYTGQQDVNAQTGSGTILATTNTQIDAANNYSFFLAGTNGNLSLIAVKDDLTAPASGKAKVRFVQAATTTTTVDLLANGVSLFSALTQKGISAYSEVAAGTYVFKVNNAGLSTTLVTSASVTLTAGKVYTVYTKGVAGASGSTAMGIDVLTLN